MSKQQLEIVKPLPKGWIQISDHCFMDKKGNPHFRIKATYKISTTKLLTKSLEEKIKYSNKNREMALKIGREDPEKNYKKTKKWRNNNFKKHQKYMDNLNDLTTECKQRVLKLRRSINSKQYIANNKKNTKKLKKRGFFSRCAEYKHDTCKNVSGRCKCSCHKNT